MASAIQLGGGRRPPPDAMLRLSQWIADAAAVCLLLAALWLLARRAAGALQRPLDPAALLITGAVLAGVSLLLRRSWPGPPTLAVSRVPPWMLRPALGLPSLAVFLVGASLTLPRSPPAAVVLFWLILAAGELLAWQSVASRWRRGQPGSTGRTTAAPPPQGPFGTPAAQPSASCGNCVGVPAQPIASDTCPPEDVTQQLTRRSAGNGFDSVHVLMRGHFAPGQRSLSLHVAFCPPLAATPQVQVRQLQGPTAQVKVAQIMPYGVRLDVRLGRFSQQPENVLVELHASEPEPAGELAVG